MLVYSLPLPPPPETTDIDLLKDLMPQHLPWQEQVQPLRLEHRHHHGCHMGIVHSDHLLAPPLYPIGDPGQSPPSFP